MLKNKPSDVGLTAVASNNLIAINKDQNIFDSKKRMKAATVEGLDQKLNSAQRSAIARNNALLAMFTAQVLFLASLYLGIHYTIQGRQLICAKEIIYRRCNAKQTAIENV